LFNNSLKDRGHRLKIKVRKIIYVIENNENLTGDLQIPDIDSVPDKSITPLGTLTENIEKKQITLALEQNRWNQSATARTLDITLRQLRYKIQKLKLNDV